MGISTIVAWVVVLALARLLYNHARLNSLPGPFYAGLSDFWRIDAPRSSGHGRELLDLHAKYGTLVRVGPNSVSVSNPAAILPVQARRIPRQRQSGTEVALPDETALQYEGLIDQSARNLLNAFRRYHTLEITAFLHFFATDFVDQLKAIPFGSTAEEKQTDYSARDVSQERCPGSLRAWLSLPGAEYLLFQGPVSRLKRGHDSPIAQRKMPSTCPNPQYHSSSDPLDSIANAVASLFVQLLTNVNTLRNLRREIASARNRAALSDLPLWEDLETLQYLDAAMKESIRHSPDRCDSCELIAPPGGVTIASHYLPEGTAIRCHSHTLHYDKEIYGERPHLFCPERWLNATATAERQMAKCLFPFAPGGLEHPTVNAAWNELKKVIVMILLKFDLQLLHIDDDPVNHTGISPDIPRMTVRFTPRVH